MRQKHVLLAAILIFVWGLLAGCGGGSGGSAQNATGRTFPLSSLSRADFLVDGRAVIRPYVMDTPEKRAEGLMFVTEAEFGEDDAMLFSFSSPASVAFYMKNTSLPLDLAYMDAQFRVFQTLELTPFDETPRPSSGPAMYALEMRRGAFARLGITEGTVLLPIAPP